MNSSLRLLYVEFRNNQLTMLDEVAGGANLSLRGANW